jgi:NADH-quinone oxidoreductase subunit J
MKLSMLIFGILTLVSAGGVVFSRKSLDSALCLVATLFFVAVHFALLNSSFLATLQILVYAGAIMILVVFVIMLLGLESDTERIEVGIPKSLSLLLVGILFSFLTYSVITQPFEPAQGFYASAKDIGYALLTKHVAGFELAAVLLLAAVVGAVTLAYDPRPPLPKGRGLSAMHKD